MSARTDPTAHAERADPTARIERWLVATVILGSTAATLALARAHAHFRGDDLGNLKLLTETSVLHFTFMPADAHFSPLHRLATAALHTLAPWNFDAALLALLCAHVLGVGYLHALHRRLWPSPSAKWLTAWYATNVFVGFQFLWWSSASHRLPYIALSIMSVYYYLRYRDTAARRAALLSVAAFVGALGFLGKGVLLAAFLATLEVCVRARPARAPMRSRAAVLAAMLGITVGFAAISSVTIEGVGATVPSLSALSGHLRFGLSKVLYGCFGLLPMVTTPALRAAMLAAGGAALVWTVWRRPLNAAAWIGGLALLAANVALPALAPRAAEWTFLAALTSRYYFECMFVIAILAATVLGTLSERDDVARAEPSRPRTDGTPGRLRIPLLALAVIVYSLTGLYSFHTALDRSTGRADARRYMSNLIDGIARIDAGNDDAIRLAPGRAPGSVVGFNAGAVGDFEILLPLLDRRVVVVPAEQATYRVTGDGRVVPSGS